MTVTPHTVMPHRCEVFTYHAGTRHGFECMDVDCDAGGSGFYTLAAAEVAGNDHSLNSWDRP